MTDLTPYKLELPERYKALYFAILFTNTHNIWLRVTFYHRHSKHYKTLILLKQIMREAFFFFLPLLFL